MKFGQRIGNFMKNDSLPLTAEAKELVEKNYEECQAIAHKLCRYHIDREEVRSEASLTMIWCAKRYKGDAGLRFATWFYCVWSKRLLKLMKLNLEQQFAYNENGCSSFEIPYKDEIDEIDFDLSNDLTQIRKRSDWRTRVILRLYYWERMSPPKIGAAMSVSAQYVRDILRTFYKTAKRKMRVHFETV